MKKLLLALAATVAFPVAAANAQVSPYVESTLATDDFDSINYGLYGGLDAPATLDGNIRLGAELGVENFASSDRDTTFYTGIIPSARFGGNTWLYGNAGLLLTDDNTGYRLGAGLRQELTRQTYAKIGVRYDDYGRNVNDVTGTVSLGFRF
jgi:opacity protein-like surface antigen